MPLFMPHIIKKKILFIGPRLHTNYLGSFKALIKNNFKLYFFAKLSNGGEDHSLIKPIIIQESYFSKIRKIIFGDIKSNNSQYFPKISKFVKLVRKIRPDYSIIRLHGRLYTYFSALIIKFFGGKIIFYDQIDLSNHKFSKLEKIEIFLRKLIFNDKLISPICSTKKTLKDNFYFVPFCSDIVKKKSFSNKKLKILSIGKFQRRKNYLLLIKVVEDLSKTINIQLNIVGECQNKSHKEHKKEIINYIESKKLNKIINIKKYIKHNKIDNLYKNNDLFILPAENEIASVSIVEALGFGLPVICSDDCGSQVYVKNGYNGFIFKKNNALSLKNKITKFTNVRNKKKFSINAFYDAKKNFSKKKYILMLNKVLYS